MTPDTDLTAEEEYEAALDGIEQETPDDARAIAAVASRRYWMRTRHAR